VTGHSRVVISIPDRWKHDSSTITFAQVLRRQELRSAILFFKYHTFGSTDLERNQRFPSRTLGCCCRGRSSTPNNRQDTTDQKAYSPTQRRLKTKPQRAMGRDTAAAAVFCIGDRNRFPLGKHLGQISAQEGFHHQRRHATPDSPKDTRNTAPSQSEAAKNVHKDCCPARQSQ